MGEGRGGGGRRKGRGDRGEWGEEIEESGEGRGEERKEEKRREEKRGKWSNGVFYHFILVQKLVHS